MIQQDTGTSQGSYRLTFGNSRKRPKGPPGEYEGISPKGESEDSLPCRCHLPWDSSSKHQLWKDIPSRSPLHVYRTT